MKAGNNDKYAQSASNTNSETFSIITLKTVFKKYH